MSKTVTGENIYFVRQQTDWRFGDLIGEFPNCRILKKILINYSFKVDFYLMLNI